MKTALDFSPISPDEVLVLAIDFSAYLATGDSVASVDSWTCTVAPSSPVPDAAPSARLSGSPSLAGAVVSQTVSTCVAGARYVMEAVVTTRNGETLSLWSYLVCEAPGVG